jgi:hypothetical protein
MAGWLGFGLEEAFAESPEIGVTRKPRPNRGLIKIETHSEPYDAVAAAKEASLPHCCLARSPRCAENADMALRRLEEFEAEWGKR